ncbi:MAG: methylenetetrahydrofolate reductase [Clostridia bacterium]|nr:methylenetetrahydrofolate reductase [Clostridia bacterium]
MRIKDILANGKVNVSCELSPPKELTSLENTAGIVAELANLNPAFISVTYGAAGTKATAEKTIEVARQIQCDNNVTALAHLTCINAEDDIIDHTLDCLHADGIENILALRGDIPEGYEFNTNAKYRHASDLAAKIKARGDFCIGGACYPEGHTESENRANDIENLKIKVDAGCDFLTTQMFFDNNILYSFMFRLLKAGIDVPIVAGIMPVVNAKQIERICRLSGTALPPRFAAIVDRFGNNPKSMRQAGIAYMTEQIIDLVANGVTNIHIYTMNKPDIAKSIMGNLSDIIN